MAAQPHCEAMTVTPEKTLSNEPAADRTKKHEPRNSPREIAETIVFVTVLVLLLKTFVAEAFVIPTGSMAETLYGIQRMVVCDQCRYKFPVNCSAEVDPPGGRPPSEITGCVCPNCMNPMTWSKATAPAWSSGDRVLVAKFLYDRNYLSAPDRHQVIVFKYPKEPQQGATAMNYIKRCVALPGETLALFRGDLYVTSSLTYPHRHPNDNPLARHTPDQMFPNDETAVERFRESMLRRMDGQPREGDFEIVRKSPAVMLEMRRIVYDNDHQPADLGAAGVRRWELPSSGCWTGDDPNAPKQFRFTPSDRTDWSWLTYAHRLGTQTRLAAANQRMRLELLEQIAHHHRRLVNVSDYPKTDDRFLITNMLGYNSGVGDPNQELLGLTPRLYWVSDLMLDLEVAVDSETGQFALELSKGNDRFQAVFDVGQGECSLVRLTGITEEERQRHRRELARRSTKLKGKGTYRVRFANFDSRLTVWVDRSLPFEDGVSYDPSRVLTPTTENDIEAPARIGALAGQFRISHLTLWRDTYYVHTDRSTTAIEIDGGSHTLQTYYVQPGHYMCLGDNSASSSDSREWGLVPERLLLGRALVVYFPFWPFNQRAGLIR
jgi:signal peptidase I